MAEISANAQTGISMKMLQGDRVERDNNRTAAALHLTGSQVAEVVSLFPTNVPFVVGRYNPISSEVHVDVFKVEKTGNKTVMLTAPFGPGHGGAYAAAMTYATASDRQMGLSPGVNPFAQFMAPGDDTFHNVGSPGAAQVIIGHAMRMSGAPIALVAQADLRAKQWTESSGGWFKKTVTQHVDGYTKPHWFVATPTQFQPRGQSYSICAQNVASPTDCPPEQVVYSGVSWSQWDGGNLPSMEDLTSQWQESHSSFTPLAWVAIVFVVVFTAGAALAAAGVAITALGPLSAAISAMAPTGAMAGMSIAAVAGIEAGFVAAVGVASGAGLQDAVNGPYQGANSGFGTGQVATTAYQASMFGGVHGHFDAPALSDGSQLTAVRQGAYGTCGPGATLAACGGASGLVPRADGSVQQNTAEFWQDNGNPMVQVFSLQAP